MLNNTNRKAMNINKLNNNLGQVLKGTDADNFSKMLDNFRFTSTSTTQQQPTMPVINVSPVQVVQIDKEGEIKEMVKKAINNQLKERNTETKVVIQEKEQEQEKEKEEKPEMVIKRKSKKKNRNLRSFTIYNISKNLNCKVTINEGRYRASNPQDAARKAFNRYCNKHNKQSSECEYFLTVKETTRGSNGDLNTYKMIRTKLKKPLVRFAGTSREYFIKYGVDVEPVQTPDACYRNQIDSKKKKSLKSSK